MSNSLATLSSIRKSLAKVETVDEAKELHDKTQAIQVYLKASGESLRIQNRAAEIRLRIERRLGELLSLMPKQHGARPLERSNTMLPRTLGELGIKKMQSSRWQAIAKVPDLEFERHVAGALAMGRELTTHAVLKLAKQLQAKSVYTGDGTGSVAESLEELKGRKFGTIYADPPWQYDNQGTRAATGNHYDTMPVAAICDMPICALAHDDCHLHLWTTNAFLFESKRVMEAWGFKYKSVFIWCKSKYGLGNYWRVAHEFLLLGIRGNAPFGKSDERSWREYQRGTHSAKPDEIRALIETVSPGPRLELFGRRAVSGWTVFGNQVRNTSSAA